MGEKLMENYEMWLCYVRTDRSAGPARIQTLHLASFN